MEVFINSPVISDDIRECAHYPLRTDITTLLPVTWQWHNHFAGINMTMSSLVDKEYKFSNIIWKSNPTFWNPECKITNSIISEDKVSIFKQLQINVIHFLSLTIKYGDATIFKCQQSKIFDCLLANSSQPFPIANDKYLPFASSNTRS